jgi:hypothetical protein
MNERKFKIMLSDAHSPIAIRKPVHTCTFDDIWKFLCEYFNVKGFELITPYPLNEQTITLGGFVLRDKVVTFKECN